MKKNSIISNHKFTGLFIVLFMVFFFGCKPYFLIESTLPPIKSEAQNGLIVYLRTFNIPNVHVVPGQYGIPTPAIEFNGIQTYLYLDKKYVGGLQNEHLTVIPAEPGEHYLSSRADLTRMTNFFSRDSLVTQSIYLNIKPGKVYFIEEMPIPNDTYVRPIVQYISDGIFKNKMDSIKFKYCHPNPKKLMDNLTDEAYKEVLDNYKGWAKAILRMQKSRRNMKGIQSKTMIYSN